MGSGNAFSFEKSSQIACSCDGAEWVRRTLSLCQVTGSQTKLAKATEGLMDSFTWENPEGQWWLQGQWEPGVCSSLDCLWLLLALWPKPTSSLQTGMWIVAAQAWWVPGESRDSLQSAGAGKAQRQTAETDAHYLLHSKSSKTTLREHLLCTRSCSMPCSTCCAVLTVSCVSAKPVEHWRISSYEWDIQR